MCIGWFRPSPAPRASVHLAAGLAFKCCLLTPPGPLLCCSPGTALQSDVQGLKVAAATLLLSADAGMGPAALVLAFAKDALDAVMQMQ